MALSYPGEYVTERVVPVAVLHLELHEAKILEKEAAKHLDPRYQEFIKMSAQEIDFWQMLLNVSEQVPGSSPFNRPAANQMIPQPPPAPEDEKPDPHHYQSSPRR